MREPKYEIVTDMTFGQLYDAVANGEEFYDNCLCLLEISGGLLEAKDSYQSEIIGQLEDGQISRKIKTSWTDRLDGALENGVWCTHGLNDDKSFSFSKYIHKEIFDGQLLVSPDSITWAFAEQLTVVAEELADQLEALRKEQSK